MFYSDRVLFELITVQFNGLCASTLMPAGKKCCRGWEILSLGLQYEPFRGVPERYYFYGEVDPFKNTTRCNR